MPYIGNAAEFILEKCGFLRFNRGMKILVIVMTASAVLLGLSSCGECACHSYNPALLRDVPVSSSRSFE